MLTADPAISVVSWLVNEISLALLIFWGILGC